MVTTWASPEPGDFVPHLDLIALDTFWPYLEVVTLIPLGLTLTW